MEILMKQYNLDHFTEKDIYTWDELIEIIENMESEIYILREEQKNYQEYVKDNFKQLTTEEQVGITNKDFI